MILLIYMQSCHASIWGYTIYNYAWLYILPCNHSAFATSSNIYDTFILFWCYFFSPTLCLIIVWSKFLFFFSCTFVSKFLFYFNHTFSIEWSLTPYIFYIVWLVKSSLSNVSKFALHMFYLILTHVEVKRYTACF